MINVYEDKLFHEDISHMFATSKTLTTLAHMIKALV